MNEETERLKDTLVRKYLGKRGIHGISIDEASDTVNVYVEHEEAASQAVTRLRKDAGALKVRTIKSPRARLAQVSRYRTG